MKTSNASGTSKYSMTSKDFKTDCIIQNYYTYLQKSDYFHSLKDLISFNTSGTGKSFRTSKPKAY